MCINPQLKLVLNKHYLLLFAKKLKVGLNLPRRAVLGNYCSFYNLNYKSVISKDLHLQ